MPSTKPVERLQSSTQFAADVVFCVACFLCGTVVNHSPGSTRPIDTISQHRQLLSNRVFTVEMQRAMMATGALRGQPLRTL